ncbi:MAG: glycogen synthase GlgA [Clostridia bacterium]|nr:glycogen synthase GlgA [Clostridia bacterium]
MKKVLFVTGEAAPFIKSGGLGDVAGALPRALCEAGVDCRVILPLYSQIPAAWREKMVYIRSIMVQNAWRKQHCGLFSCQVGAVTYYFIDNEYYFKRYAIYGENDDGERFAYFCRAVLSALGEIDFIPDVLHCNDWHTALIPVLLDTEARNWSGYRDIKTVFTIHNIEFQGKYDSYILGDVFGMGERERPLLYYGGCLNLMKGAIECANAVTTVSESYADEILNPYYSYGLHHILSARKYKLSGILNGIDTVAFDPQTDPALPYHYSFESRAQKFRNKKALQEELGLPTDNQKALIGMVTRLTLQKGLDLVRQEFNNIIKEDVQFVLLGTGDYEYEQYFRDIQAQYPDKVRCIINFDAKLAQRIYAGADLFLMPSKFEPCGLAQMIAMRYGTLPIVNAVGGLKDTVYPFNPTTGEGRGITFQSYNSGDMMDAIRRGVALFKNKSAYSKAKANAMAGDYSWAVSAQKYINLYNNI